MEIKTMEKNFRAGTFKSEYETKLGEDLWCFLNSTELIGQLETATNLRRPAVEGIEQSLLVKFGEQDKKGIVKQMIGKMVRQILEDKGYGFVKTGVRIKNQLLFTSGARYEERWEEKSNHLTKFEFDGEEYEIRVYQSAVCSEKYLTCVFDTQTQPTLIKWYASSYPWNVMVGMKKSLGISLDDLIKNEIESVETSFIGLKKRKQRNASV